MRRVACSPMHRHNYRPDVDGLRAVAVLAVVIYHAGFGIVPGGYVGVDVFFVISGFLITGLIRQEIACAGGFDFSGFYVRRIRRLFPALFTVVLASGGFACLLYSPEELQRFATSMMSSIASVSNVHFWLQSGYFEASSSSKPLLHTWSLSVEEQFYLLWPLLIFWLVRKRSHAAPVILAAIALVSLTLNLGIHKASDLIALPPEDLSSAMFFLLPFRVFEFAIGGLLTWAPHRPEGNGASREFLLFAGLALLAYTFVTFTEETPFPTYNALVPCVGTAAIIYAGDTRFLGKLLSNPASVWLGQRSYSLYLVHWPLMVFAVQAGGEPTLANRVLLVAVGVGLAALLYRFVEVPWRTPRASDLRFKPTFGWAAVLSLLLIGTGGSMLHHRGWEWRIGAERQAYKLASGDFHQAQFGGTGIAERQLVPLGRSAASPVFVLAGDSFARQYANAMHERLSAQEIAAFGLFDNGCILGPGVTSYAKGVRDEECATQYDSLRALLTAHPTMGVVLAQRWNGYKERIGPRQGGERFELSDAEYAALITGQVEQLVRENGRSRNYVLVGTPAPLQGKTESLRDCLYRPAVFSSACSSEWPASNTTMNEALRHLAEKHENVTYLDPRDVLCAGGICHAVSDGHAVHSDRSHLSKKGGELVVRHFWQHFVQPPPGASMKLTSTATDER